MPKLDDLSTFNSAEMLVRLAYTWERMALSKPALRIASSGVVVCLQHTCSHGLTGEILV
jgi:hypothetical protein